MTIDIKIEWVEKLNKSLKNFANNDLTEARRKRLNEAAVLLQWEAKKQAPVDKWILRKSIFLDVQQYEASVYSGVPYSIYVHEWTSAHIIKPINKKALFWRWAEHPVFEVLHPWTKPNPFFQRAFENKQNEIMQRFNSILLSYMEEIKWSTS